MKMDRKSALLLTLLYFVHDTVSKGIDDYILNFEHVDYSSEELHDRHMRHRRSADHPVHLNINAFNRNFKLVLKHDSSVFSKDLRLHFKGRESKPDLSFLYNGKVEGHPGSRVHGAIIEGVFRGSFTLPSENETYYVEKSLRYFDNPVTHSVIYRESEMNLDPYRERRERERREAIDKGYCGNSAAREWMHSVVSSEYIPANRAKRSEMTWQEVRTDNHNIYTENANTADKPHSRKKRGNLGARNSCFMSLTSDIMLWRFYMENTNNREDVARDEILAFFASHITAINNIYGRTVFETYDKKLNFSGVQFRVQNTKIMTEADCSSTSNTLQNFCDKNIDVSNFLNLNSLLNHDNFCLAYVFTYRDFSGGTLGLAWVGSPTNSAGGLCERNKKFQEGSALVDKSLNTGVVTTVNYGKNVPAKVSQLTFAHEVGHNFGSPHDSGTECVPSSGSSSNGGNYIMFSSATMGDKPNNSQFSRCSLDNITQVLNSVINQLNNKVNCFEESEAAFCGNGLVEEGEECDCGFENDCTDQCCNPKPSDSTQNSDLACTLKSGFLCSPTQGPCCSDRCTYIQQSDNKTCRYKQDCFSASYCDGSGAHCPNSTLATDGSFCNNFGFTCQEGECRGSLCENFGWVECFLTGSTNTQAERELLCKLGCRENDSSECIISNDADALVKYPAYQGMIDQVLVGRNQTNTGNGVPLAGGTPCNNFQGYCDVFSSCRSIDADGPLTRLKNLIFSPETLENITNWIVENWWAVLLMAIGLVLAMGLFIKFCAVHTPSSNPKAKPARKLSETMTLRRRRNQNRQNPSSQSQAPQQVRYPQNPQGPPPPYPGSSSHSSHMGPPHGHGKGKGRHKSKDMEMGRI